MEPEQFLRRCMETWGMQGEKFSCLLGKTLVAVTNLDNTELLFDTADGQVYMLYHDQDCCESVAIEDICGDLQDIIGEPILLAEKVTQSDGEPGVKGKEGEYEDSFTWTFYKLSTRKGGVTIRWYGTSNGYYSESVDFCRLVPYRA